MYQNDAFSPIFMFFRVFRVFRVRETTTVLLLIILSYSQLQQISYGLARSQPQRMSDVS